MYSWGLALLYALYILVLKIELWETYYHFSPFTKIWISKMWRDLPKDTEPVSGAVKILMKAIFFYQSQNRDQNRD